ncbi:hypothetical protein ES702_03433 [subsurface metagenome]
MYRSINTTTEAGAALIATLQEQTRITLAAETTHTMKVKDYENAKKEYGDLEDVDTSDLVAVARANLLQMAVNELAEAETKVKLARAQLETIQRDLKKLVEAGTEVDDSLVALLEEMKLEE